MKIEISMLFLVKVVNIKNEMCKSYTITNKNKIIIKIRFKLKYLTKLINLIYYINIPNLFIYVGINQLEDYLIFSGANFLTVMLVFLVVTHFCNPNIYFKFISLENPFALSQHLVNKTGKH